MNKEDLNDTFLDMIRSNYRAEKLILKTLPKMIESASYEDLKEVFKKHLEETKTQIQKLEAIFQLLGASPKEKRCPGMKGLIKECNKIMDMDYLASALRDACLITSAQKIKHYEIAAYGGLSVFVTHLGKALKNEKFEKIQQLLHEILQEEKQADDKLTELAEGTRRMKGIHEEAEKEIVSCCSKD